MAGARRGLRGIRADGRGKLRRAVLVTVGLGLVGLAVWVVLRQRESILAGFDHAAGSPWWAIALVVIFPLVSVLMTSISLWALTLRYGRVGLFEMGSLVSGAMLLNYLPMRPGMLGRMAYHKRVNKIALRDSVRVLVEAVVLSVGSATVLLGLGVAGALGLGVWLDVLALGLPVVALLILAGAFGRGRWAGLFVAGAVRYVDMLIWTGRYALLLWMLGEPVSLETAVVIASLSQLAMLVPTGGGGFGVREWTVGLVGVSLGAPLETALVADLINRAAELAVAVPVGLVGLWVVRRRASLACGVRMSGSPKDEACDQTDPENRGGQAEQQRPPEHREL